MSAKANAPAKPPSVSASLSRHARKCIICNHPDRVAIEEDFLRWQSPEFLARAYQLSYRSAIYRHAHATGLFKTRSRMVRCVLENILERWQEAPITAMSIVRAVHAFTRITEDGRWVEPSQQIKVSRLAEATPAPAPPAPPPPLAARVAPPQQAETPAPPANGETSLADLPDDAYDPIQSLHPGYAPGDYFPGARAESNRDIQELEAKPNG